MSGAFDQLAPEIQHAIFRLGWTELRPIQAESIRVILTTGTDLILAAPTAGGKTEAAFLPILSRLCEDRTLLAVYVSPLKALINDQFGRLETLCEFAEIPIHRWHGDVDPQAKARFRASPFGVLLITPESLESNFINYGSAIPRLYAKTAFVVIDELHAFVENVRGIHLRSLLARLTILAKCQPRLVGLSATLGSPEGAKKYLRPDNPSQVTFLEEKSEGREVLIAVRSYISRPRYEANDPERKDSLVRRLTVEEAYQVTTGVVGSSWKESKPLTVYGESFPLGDADPALAGKDALDEIAQEVAHNFREHTNLVFSNQRATVEELVDMLQEISEEEKWPQNPFVPHHGSLTKELREDAEARLKSGRPTTAVCTGTLELGIDIGDVHTVGQIDPPWSAAALQQRLGRSGRRNGEPSRLRLYARDRTPTLESSLSDLLFLDLIRSIALVDLFLNQWVEPLDGQRLHLSTMIHQVLSLLRQTGGLHSKSAYAILCKEGPFRNVPAPMFLEVLRGLGEKEIIEQMATGEIILAPAGERLVAAKEFYAAFKSTEGFTVEHGSNVIGELPASAVPPPGESFILDGRRWEVTDVVQERKTVEVVPTRERKVTVFMGEGGDIDTKVIRQMRAVLLSSDTPAYLDKPARRLLAAARHAASQSGIASDGVVVGTGLVTWAPWVGSRTLRTLRSMLQAIGKETTNESVMLKLALPGREAFTDLLHQLHDQTLDPVEVADRLPVKTFDRFDELLPEEVLNEMNARDRLDLTGAREAVELALKLPSPRNSGAMG
jgi:ATP-dependent Lhr-like helicase